MKKYSEEELTRKREASSVSDASINEAQNNEKSEKQKKKKAKQKQIAHFDICFPSVTFSFEILMHFFRTTHRPLMVNKCTNSF
ncbi:hypothetical protein DPMN_041365 [Dreissena polymorpha]|uniref:Uncharacterized protein n=1 Tax=Dreissena polymorpha TaxID=45954 RepID=A0A9D4CZA4_DREPO|nr:hypothetical protein DPMN_041365 [Dreissena polymorpha]